MKRSKRLILIVVAIVLVLVSVWGIYVNDYYRADETALQAMDSPVIQKTEDYVTFPSASGNRGFIFYPGGKVEHIAYAPLMRALSEQGILCVLVKMPFHLAVLDRNAADGIQEKYPLIEEWYIGGHSLGEVWLPAMLQTI